MEKIKILFIHSQLVCGGAEQALFDLVSLMDKTKFDITVMVQYDGGVWESKFKDAGFPVISAWGVQKRANNPIVKLLNFIKRRKIAHARKHNGTGLINICFESSFDIIVSYNVLSMHGVGFAGTAKTVKFIHGDMQTNDAFYRNIMGIGDALKHFNRIVCVSDTAKDSFERITGISNGVFRYYNPINSDNIRKLAQQEIRLPTDVPIICAVGRLSREKGFDRLIRIHKTLMDKRIQHKLIIVGDGPEKANLFTSISQNCVQNSVIMVGYSDNPYPYIKNSSFLVCPSYTEGLGLVAMEALCLGVPVVAAVPSIGEILGNDETCGIITKNDDASLEVGIFRMLTDKAFYSKTKSGAQKRSSFFDGHRMVKEIENMFQELVKNDSK